MPVANSDVVSAVQLGVLLGQIEAFAKAGALIGLLPSEYTYIAGDAFRNAETSWNSMRTSIPSLPDQDAQFEVLGKILEVGSAQLDNVWQATENLQVSLMAVFPPTARELASATYLGIRFGNSEAFSDLAGRLGSHWPDYRLWIIQQVTTTIPELATSSSAFSHVPEITTFLAEYLDKLVNFGTDVRDFQQAIEATLRLFLGQLSDAPPALSVGAAKVPLLAQSPDGRYWIGNQNVQLGELSMAGYDLKPPQGVNDFPQCRALLLTSAGQQIALVSVDLVLVYQNLIQEVRNRVLALTGIRNVVVVATHTHSSYDFTRYFTPGADGYTTFGKLLSDAVVLALGLSDPAEAGVSRSEARIGFNRSPRTVAGGQTTSSAMLTGVGQPYTRDQWVNDHPLDPVDNEVVVLHFRRTNPGSRNLHIATLLNYACHGVVLGATNLQLSADWPGAAMQALDQKFGTTSGETAPYLSLFLQGCSGNIDPWLALTNDFGQVHSYGQEVADSAAFAVSGIGQFYRGITLGFTSQQIKVQPASDSQPSPPASAEVNSITFGAQLSASIVTFPAEMFVELGQEVKLKAIGMGINFNLVCGYANDAIGYVPSETVYNTGGYETDGWKPVNPPNQGGVLTARSTGEQLVSAALSALSELHGH